MGDPAGPASMSKDHETLDIFTSKASTAIESPARFLGPSSTSKGRRDHQILSNPRRGVPYPFPDRNVYGCKWARQ